ncbi:MAG: thiolase family protein [Sphingorhabdus sp.]
MARSKFEDRAIISGIGQSRLDRQLEESALSLTIDSIQEALSDSGLTLKDIDGVASWPGYSSEDNGFSPVGVPMVKEALGLNLSWYAGCSEGPGQFASIINAMLAVAAGLCRHVVCFRTLKEGSARRAGRGGMGFDKRFQWQLPFHAYSAANWLALTAQRYMHEFGATREQLAQIALTARRHAALNPNALYRDPMALEDYLSARMISEPLCLFDCDVPIDGATAIIISAADAAPDLKNKPVRIEAVGCALHQRDSWDQTENFTEMAAHDAAKAMWARTDLKPKDVDVAEIYDGFSILTLFWLEALGFCGHGEAATFVEGGANISRDGLLPLNTHGGQLSAGRTHGLGFLHEACLQLRGQGGARQLPRRPEIAIATAGGGPLGAALLLRREL